MGDKNAIQSQKKAPQRQPDEIEISTNGKNHQVKAKGNVANGIAVAASAIVGFTVGVLLLGGNTR